MGPDLTIERQLAVAARPTAVVLGPVSVVLPTLNESENITATITGILQNVPGLVEVIVIDDNSSDGTRERVAALGVPRVRVIQRMEGHGLASAIARGVQESRGEVIVWMDADGGMPPAKLPEMIARLEGCDVVIGSRYVPGGADRRAWMRRYASLFINGLARAVLGYGIRDYDSGFVVVRRHVLDQVPIVPVGYGAYFIEFVYTACRKKFRVGEVPYVFRERTHGISKSCPSLGRFAWLGCTYAFQIIRARWRCAGLRRASRIIQPSFERVDHRGVLRELLSGGRWTTLLQGEMRTGAILGNHYHRRTDVFFFMEHGRARVRTVTPRSGRSQELVVTAQQGVLLRAGVAHAIQFEQPSTFFLLKSRPHQDRRSDIVPYQVC